MDIQKMQGIGVFIDNSSSKANPFGQNRIAERAYRRAERLSAGIVLLTNHVSEKEHLRQAARELSLALVSGILSVRDEMRSSTSGRVSGLKATVRNLMTVIRLLAVSGNISIQNAEAVTEALDSLVEFIQASQKSNFAESVLLGREDFLDVRETSSKHNRTIDTALKDSASSVSDEDSRTSSRPPNTTNVSHMSSRSLAILEVLSGGKELGIRDIASNLPEYSEKMIQRELAELVRKASVKKEGLKRWSRYSII